MDKFYIETLSEIETAINYKSTYSLSAFSTSSISSCLSGKIVTYFEAYTLFSKPPKIYSAVISSFQRTELFLLVDYHCHR